MKWYKYPETKPVSGSSKAMRRCLLWVELSQLTDPVFEINVQPYTKMMGVFYKDQWLNPLKNEALGDKFSVKYYMYLDDIPGPEEELKRMNK